MIYLSIFLPVYLLSYIFRQGPGVFYNGYIGENLVKDVQAAGGIITMDDLRSYK